MKDSSFKVYNLASCSSIEKIWKSCRRKERTKQAKKLRAKINIIPYNKVEGLDWKRPNLKRIDAFRRRVEAGGAKVTVRMEKGHDIDAACGQLRLRQEKEQAAENTSCNN